VCEWTEADDYDLDYDLDKDVPIAKEILAGLELAQERCNDLKDGDEAPPEYFPCMATLIVDGARLANLSKVLYELREKYPVPNG
jgi:hypothetical protein